MFNVVRHNLAPCPPYTTPFDEHRGWLSSTSDHLNSVTRHLPHHLPCCLSPPPTQPAIPSDARNLLSRYPSVTLGGIETQIYSKKRKRLCFHASIALPSSSVFAPVFPFGDLLGDCSSSEMPVLFLYHNVALMRFGDRITTTFQIAVSW